MGPESILLSFLALLVVSVVLRRLRPVAVPPPPFPRQSVDACAIRLSIIIPARNEAENLPRLLQSLKTGSLCPAEIIVVDDASDDGTADVARQQGARVVAAGALPDGWRGKPWACFQGTRHAQGTHFLFLDADTWVSQDGLARMLAMLPTAGGALSLLPDHRMQRPYEQGSAVFHLIMAWSVGVIAPRGIPRRETGLLGQSLLIDRDTYQDCGGHATVRGAMLEHLALSAHLRRQGVMPVSATGREVLCMRMYPGGLRQLVNGWAKTFAQGTSHTPPAAKLGVGLWISTGWLIAGGLGWAIARGQPGALGAWGALYLVYALQSDRWLRGLGNYAILSALCYPLHLMFFCWVFLRSARIARGRSSTEWKGRRLTVGQESLR